MLNKIKRICKYLLYFLWSNTIYGLIVYYVFTWLSGYSLSWAYLGNLMLIVFGLTIDEQAIKMLHSKKLVTQLKGEKNIEKNYRLVQSITDSFISFKTTLYLFYVFTLVISQIINFNPELLSEGIRNFINANAYSILFLIALDRLIAQFSNDREKMKEASEKLKKSLTETQN